MGKGGARPMKDLGKFAALTAAAAFVLYMLNLFNEPVCS